MTAFSHTQHVVERSLQQAPDYTFQGLRSRMSGACWMHPECELSTQDMADHVLVHHLGGSTRIERSSGGRVTGRHSRHGSTTFVSCDHETTWRVWGQAEVMHLYLPPALLSDYALQDGGFSAAPRIDEFFAAEDPWLAGFFAMLRAEHEHLLPGDRQEKHEDTLLLDQLELSLLRHLVMRHSGARASQLDALASRQAQARLSPARLNKVVAFMEERFASPLQLRELTAIVNMSRDHFVRAFRNTVGQTPYQYLLAIRVARAAQLLRGHQALTVAEVAGQCGFKSAAHFSTTFSKMRGCSPSQYRATV